LTSHITFSNILHTIIKAPADIKESEVKLGILSAGSRTRANITGKLAPGLQIDVMVLKNTLTLACDDTIIVNEHDIRPGSRRSFTDLNELYKRKSRLPVHTNFFKCIEDGDTIMIILHEVAT
jgi:hypothetical protein